MKILIAASIQAKGSYEEEQLAKKLCAQLQMLGYETDFLLLPYENDVLSLPEQLLAYQLLEIHTCDRLITIGYPACVLEHHNKTVYLFQLEPAIHEYWDSEYGVLANVQYSQILYSINKVEYNALHKANSVICSSELLVSDIKKKYLLEAKTLYCPPLPFEGAADQGKYKDYILCESCLAPYSRPELVIELAKALHEKRVLLFIPNTDRVYMDTLLKWISANKLEDRLIPIARMASNREILNASAVFIPDYNSRRVSNIALKGLSLGKPTYAMKDSGAVCELLLNKYILDAQRLSTLDSPGPPIDVKHNKKQIPDMKYFAEKMVEK